MPRDTAFTETSGEMQEAPIFAAQASRILRNSQEHPEDEGELPEPEVPEGLFDTPWPEDEDLESAESSGTTTTTTGEGDPESEGSSESTTTTTPYA